MIIKSFNKNKIVYFVFAALAVGLFFAQGVPVAFAISASGPIVPCGESGNPCTICHIPYLVKNLADYMFSYIGIPLAVLIFAIAGIRMIIGSSKESEITAAKSMITNALIGLGIMLAAWVMVNTAMLLLTGGQTSFQGALFSGPWNQLPPTQNCPLEGPVGSLQQSGGGAGPIGGGSSSSSGGGTGTTGGGGATAERRFVLTTTDPVTGVTAQIGSFRSQAECQAEAQAMGSFSAPVCDAIPVTQIPDALTEYIFAPDRKVAAADARTFAADHAIDINKNECPVGVAYQDVAGGCTSLGGVLGTTLNGVEKLKIQCACNIKITGGTELGHTEGGASHMTGKKLDLEANKDLTDYIRRKDANGNFVNKVGSRSDGTPTYTTSEGVVYAYEINPTHWDVQFSK